MSQATSSKSDHRAKEIKHVLKRAGYVKPRMIVHTLQGSIWRASIKRSNEKTQNIVAKVTSKTLHSESMTIYNGKKYHIAEDIMKEMRIQRYLTETDPECPDSIVKIRESFVTDTDIYLIMEDGGVSLFDFVSKAHNLIQTGSIEICEWHNIVKVIFKQMLECIKYIHSKGVCHYDISLENWLINDVGVDVEQTDDGRTKATFCVDEVQIKLCDFGLAERFRGESSFESNKFCGKARYQSPEIVSRKNDFNAKSNDVWCLGICLFMMIIGGAPWNQASAKDSGFRRIMNDKNGLLEILRSWDRLAYIDNNLIFLFESIFKYEENRSDLGEIEVHSWMHI